MGNAAGLVVVALLVAVSVLVVVVLVVLVVAFFVTVAPTYVSSKFLGATVPAVPVVFLGLEMLVALM